ncbi:MAG: S1 RNA-binding domain-containing protein [Clostridia bacterium]|nr:S1 RNA-binding domain-containing protein [Clostridia bacterium]
MTEFFPEGILLNTSENKAATSSLAALYEAMYKQKILEGRAVMCSKEHDLIVDLGGIRGVIPREEGALGIREGYVRDIAVITRVNRPVSFVVTDISDNKNVRLSRRLAQQLCSDNYISRLVPGDIINARITHFESFGAFADIGCGTAALLPISNMSVSRINHPSERFSVGEDIKAIVSSTENGRICLSHKELLGTWEENASRFEIGQTVTGVIRSIESYGAFVELTPNLAGLAELKSGIRVGMQVSVYIKNIIPEKMKVKLIIIDSFESETNKPQNTGYFFTGTKINRFTYSPECCSRVIETVFI